MIHQGGVSGIWYLKVGMSKCCLAVSDSVPTLCQLISLPKVVDNMVYEVQYIFSLMFKSVSAQCWKPFGPTLISNKIILCDLGIFVKGPSILSQNNTLHNASIGHCGIMYKIAPFWPFRVEL